MDWYKYHDKIIFLEPMIWMIRFDDISEILIFDRV